MEAQKLIFLTGVNSNLKGHEPAANSFGGFLHDRGLLSLAVDSRTEKLVCIDYSPSVDKEIKKLGLSQENCTLVRMEPSVVLPANYARSRKRQFGTIITLGGFSSQASISALWPLLWPSASDIKQLHASERAERVVVINGNKISFLKGELYSLRRKAIRELEGIDLYGTQWDSHITTRLLIALKSFTHAALSLKLPRLSGLSLWFQPYPDAKGEVRDKRKTMSSYKYALIIENSPEYMSEKLFDAFFAGCMPIYVGPPVGNYGIPEGLVFQAEPKVSAIAESLAQAKNSDFKAHQQKLQEFLGDYRTISRWSQESVYDEILRLVLGD